LYEVKLVEVKPREWYTGSLRAPRIAPASGRATRMDLHQAPHRRIWAPRLRAWAEADRLQRHEDKLLLVLTLLIGAGVGLVVVAFILVTERLGARLYPAQGPGWHRLAIPTAGALLSGWLLARYFPNARGSGIPQTKTALVLHRGFIRLTTVLGKFGCSSLSLASGIALGREGPTVQVGAGIASVLGRRLGLGPRRVQALIPIGTSAALAAAFNTPIAAVLFTLEEILGDLHAPVLGSIVLSSATSWAVLHLVLGDEPLFHVPAYQLVHPMELPIYAILGVAGGLVSVAFVKLLLGLRRGFLSLPKATQWWQPAVGGLVVGLLGWFVPEVLGVGYGHVGEALNGNLLLGTMALLLVLKLVATAACYASGNAGGIFGPSLFIGAMLGGTVGSLAHAGLPDVTGSAGAYALVGMGTAFAGIVRAPMTSVIMIFEITRDYSIIVPVMIANLLSYFISQRLQPEPVYEALLHQDGIRLPPARAHISGLTVEQAMRAPAEVAAANERVADRLSNVGRPDADLAADVWPVVENGRFLGMVTRQQLVEAAAAGRGGWPLSDLLHVPAEPVTADTFPHIHADQGVDVVLQRMGQARLTVLPVVSRTDVHDLLGVVALTDMPRAYGSGEEAESAAEAHHDEATSARALLTVVVGGVLGLFLLGGFLAHHYYAARLETSAASYQAGRNLEREGRLEEAIEQFRAALSLTHSEPYRLALGVALARAGRGAEATVYLSEVLRTDPNSGPANLAMAHALKAQTDPAASIAAYRKALDGVWPKGTQAQRIEAAFELVDVLARRDDSRQAIAELLRLTGQTADPGALARIGQRLLVLGSLRQAADVFHQVIVASPRDAAAFGGLGEAELAQDNYPAARAAFDRAVQIDPTNESARAQSALCGRVLALDPTVRGLRSAERYERSRQLIKSVLTAVETCSPAIPGTPIPAVARARQVLASSRHPGSLADATDDNIHLAEELWAGRPPACAGAGSDEAAVRVLARLAK